MKLAILALVMALSLVQYAEAWRGGWGGRWGGWGGRWGGWGGLGYAYPYYGYGYTYPYYTYPYYGYYGKRDATEMTAPKGATNRTECLYVKETSMLSCFGQTEKPVECTAELRWNKPITFKVLALATSEEGGLLSEMKYRILPRKIDNTAWQRDLVLEGPTEKHISLYHSDKYNDYGIKVKDMTCFKNIVDLLKKSTRNELVHLEGDSTTTTTKPTAHIVAGLVWSDKHPAGPKQLTEEDSHMTERDEILHDDVETALLVEEIKNQVKREILMQERFIKESVQTNEEDRKVALVEPKKVTIVTKKTKQTFCPCPDDLTGKKWQTHCC